jgi:hypothetical protein
VPVVLGRCPNCGAHASGVYLREKVEGDGQTWRRIVGLGACSDCRLFFHLLADPNTREDPWTFAEVRPLVERALSALDRMRPSD